MPVSLPRLLRCLLSRAHRAVSARARHAPFASVWDETSLALQCDLLRRIAGVAANEGVPLFLFWGTLLGHVREARILPWDDDVDLAVIGLDAAGWAKFRAALHAAGLATHELNPGERILKVCDPAHPHRTGYPWSWPFVDLFPYSDPARGETQAGCDPLPAPRELILPGRPVVFEGASLREPRDARALLDRFYPGWRERESSPSWDHRRERERLEVVSRPIITDAEGRKTGPRAS